LPALATIVIDNAAGREFPAPRSERSELAHGSSNQRRKGEIKMKNPLDSLWGTIISGLVLTVILYFVVQSLIH
jgi:hypothetical protein